MLISLFLLTGATVAPVFQFPAATSNLTSMSASTDEVQDMVKKGLTELAKGKNEEALETLTQAHKKSGGSVATDLMLQRARMSNGELDDAFDRILDLESVSENPADTSYAIGAGRYLFAKREEAKAGGDPGGAFDEACAYLEEAVMADRDAYPDAWRMLAESARFTGKDAMTVPAIKRALGVCRDAATLKLAAEIRVAKGAKLLGAEGTKEKGQGLLEQGIMDAEEAAKLMGDDKTSAGALASTHLQRGVGLLWLEKKDEAQGAYAEAMGWDPTQVDYGQLYGVLTDEAGTLKPFVRTLEGGAAMFEKRWGKDIASDASLWWWLGYGQQALGKFDESITSMEKAVTKFPAFANAHWYMGLAHYKKGEEHYPKAAAAWRTFADVDRPGFVAFVNADKDAKDILGFTIFKLWGGGRGGDGSELAADLSELVLLTDEQKAQNWNDVGLMHRDAGALVARMEDPSGAMMTAAEHWERSLEAYNKAIELDRKPYYLNDGAVLLHFYLERDYDQAIAMYNEAEKMATKALEGELDKDEKALVETALKDSKDNRARLLKKIEDAKKKKEGDGATGDDKG